MKLDKRQKVLVGALAGILLLWQGGGVLWNIFFGPLATRSAQLTTIEQRLKAKQDEEFDLKLTQRQIKQWEQRSLPPDPVVASNRYHHWLLDLANRHKLNKLSVTPKRISSGPAGQVFTRIPVTVTAECDMQQLCRFLYDFYRTDLLHKVTYMSVEGLDHKTNPTLKVSLELEGLSLTSAKPRSELFVGKQEQAVAQSMAKKTLDDFQNLIAQNQFSRGYNGPSKPPAPPTPPAPPAAPFDSAPYTRLIGLTEVGGQLDAWIYDSTANQNKFVKAGEEFEISGVKGKVLQTQPRYIILRVNEKNWKLELGQNLKQMVEVKTNDLPAATTPTSESTQPATGSPPTGSLPTTSSSPTTSPNPASSVPTTSNPA